MGKQRTEVKITLRVPSDVAEAMKQLAREHARSLNGELAWALQGYIARQQQKRAR
jgi:hypothetical protein